MLKEEFEDLIKRDVSDELYKDIEVVYDALPDYMDKLYFAGAILKEAAKKLFGQEHNIVYMEKSAYSLIIL